MATHGREVYAIEQPVQLLHRELNDCQFIARPYKARTLQSLLQQPESVSIPAQYLDSVTSAVAEHKHRVGKCIEAQTMLDQTGQTVDVFTEIYGIGVQVHRKSPTNTVLDSCGCQMSTR